MRTTIPAEPKRKLKLDNRKLKKIFLSVVIIQFILIILNFGMIGIGLAAGIDLKVEPSPLSSASNDGTGQIAISWAYSYDFFNASVYHISIVSQNGNVIFSSLYHVTDKKSAERSPISGSYIWNVPKGQAEGMYFANLVVRSDVTGIDYEFSMPFLIAKDQGTIIISKFEDINGNQVIDQNDKKLSGWQFQITSPRNESITYITGEDGTIKIPQAATGIYNIKEIQGPGYMPTAPIKIVYLLKNSTVSVIFFDSNNTGSPSTGSPNTVSPSLYLLLTLVLISFLLVFVSLRIRGKRNG